METAHRFPFLHPNPEEDLESFLQRAAAIHRWPESTRADDLRVLAKLLRAFADGTDAARFGAYILRALSFSADPYMALRHFDRYLRATGETTPRELENLRDNPEHLHFLCSLFAFSSYLSEIVIARPDFLDWAFRLSKLNKEKSLERYREQLAAWMDGIIGMEARRDALVLYKKRELLRIGIRDIREMADTGALCRELSNLAQAITETVCRDLHAAMVERHGRPICESDGTESGYAIFAMGKLGAGELNFSSDLDLLFLYDEEGQTEGRPEGLGGAMVRRLTNHEFFTRLSSDICTYIGDRTAGGFLFRVDARLRPEGAAGPLARSRAAYVAYMMTQASLWEKVAYQKARFLAGDPAVGADFEKVVEGFVYTNNVASDLFPEIARLKKRIDFESLDEEGRQQDIKRGWGGIREIEFIVSGLQLMHGQERPQLRVRSTLKAIDLLQREKLMEAEIAKPLIKAYHLYRRIEHTLQMMNESQTHQMPSRPDDREALALRCGFLRPEDFEKTLMEYRQFVRGEFERLYHDDEPERELTLADHLENATEEPPEDTLAQLRPVGLADPEGFRALQKLARGTREFTPSARGRQDFRRLLPMLLEELPNVALQRQAVHHFELLLHAMRGYAWIYELCLSHPPILKLLLRTMGFGSLLARQLIAHPEWLDEIFHDDGLKEARTENELARFRMDTSRPVEEQLRELRQFKQLETFLISLQEVLAVTTSANGARRTTLVAERVLQELCRIAEFEAAGGEQIPVQWSIIGLGGLGDGQVHAFGDLDIAFVVEDDREWRGERAARWVDRMGQSVIRNMSAIAPEGQLWKVDARLRPDGANAPLAATVDRYIRYYRDEAGLWEWQALTKARSVAGDVDFGRNLLERLYALYGEKGAPANLREEVAGMRGRMETSLKLPSNALFDVKLSPGGVVDVEFLVQYRQLCHPPEAAHLFPVTTERAIELLTDRGDFTPPDRDFMLEHLRTLRAVQRHHRLLWETIKDQFPRDRDRQGALARGLADQMLVSGLKRIDLLPDDMTAMRSIFQKYLG